MQGRQGRGYNTADGLEVLHALGAGGARGEAAAGGQLASGRHPLLLCTQTPRGCASAARAGNQPAPDPGSHQDQGAAGRHGLRATARGQTAGGPGRPDSRSNVFCGSVPAQHSRAQPVTVRPAPSWRGRQQRRVCGLSVFHHVGRAPGRHALPGQQEPKGELRVPSRTRQGAASPSHSCTAALGAAFLILGSRGSGDLRWQQPHSLAVSTPGWMRAAPCRSGSGLQTRCVRGHGGHTAVSTGPRHTGLAHLLAKPWLNNTAMAVGSRWGPPSPGGAAWPTNTHRQLPRPCDSEQIHSNKLTPSV